MKQKVILVSLVLVLLVLTGCEEKVKQPTVYVESEEPAQKNIVQQNSNIAAAASGESQGTKEDSNKKTTESDLTICEENCGTVDIDLEDYPLPFFKGTKLNTYVIIGAEATSLEVVAATELLAGVSFSSRLGDYSPDTLDTDLNSIADKNAILIGNPCNNKFIAKLMPYSNDCLEDYKPGQAIIKLFRTGENTYALVVGGYSGQDTRRAAQYLGDYESNILEDNEMIV